MSKLTAWFNRSRKAIVGFCLPVVPVVVATVENGWTRESAALLLVAVLTGLGVYGTTNAPVGAADGAQ